MKKVVTEYQNEIPLADISSFTPIFIKEDGKFRGMITEEKDGWGMNFSTFKTNIPRFSTVRECILHGQERGFEFFVED